MYITAILVMIGQVLGHYRLYSDHTGERQNIYGTTGKYQNIYNVSLVSYELYPIKFDLLFLQ